MYILSAHYWEQAVEPVRYHHDWHQIIFVTEGEIEVTVQGEPFRVTAGSMILLGRYEEHSLRSLCGDYKRYILCISADIPHAETTDRLLSALLMNRSKHFRRVIDTGDCRAEIEGLFSAICREYKSRPSHCEEMADLLFRQFLILLSRTEPDLFREESHRHAELTNKIRRRLERDYAERFSLTALAEEFHVSPSHLSHLFKEITGYTPIAYLLTVRFSEAKKFLTTTDLSIKEIVYRCGFSDESNFSRTFRQRTGMTPMEYRNRARAAELPK